MERNKHLESREFTKEKQDVRVSADDSFNNRDSVDASIKH
jgi:hypothetical protein